MGRGHHRGMGMNLGQQAQHQLAGMRAMVIGTLVQRRKFCFNTFVNSLFTQRGRRYPASQQADRDRSMPEFGKKINHFRHNRANLNWRVFGQNSA